MLESVSLDTRFVRVPTVGEAKHVTPGKARGFLYLPLNFSANTKFPQNIYDCTLKIERQDNTEQEASRIFSDLTASLSLSHLQLPSFLSFTHLAKGKLSQKLSWSPESLSDCSEEMWRIFTTVTHRVNKENQDNYQTPSSFRWAVLRLHSARKGFLQFSLN